MSDKDTLLKNAKQEIRSLLITSPSFSLEQFLKSYRDLIGRHVPFREFGYNSELEFLTSMPDVVRIQRDRWSTSLIAVADETTAHIQKLVLKQKPSKVKRNSSRSSMSFRPQHHYVPPPRHSFKPTVPAILKVEISDLIQCYQDGVSLSNILIAFKRKYGKNLDFKYVGFHTLEDIIRAIPELNLYTINNDIRVYHVRPVARRSRNIINGNFTQPPTVHEETKVYFQSASGIEQKFPQHHSFASSVSQINHTERQSPAIHDKEYGLYSEACSTAQPFAINVKGVADIKQKNSSQVQPSVAPLGLQSKHTKMHSSAINHVKSELLFEKPTMSGVENTSKIHTPKKAQSVGNTNLANSESVDTSGISTAMKMDFKKVLQKYPDGIWASEFPPLYQETIGNSFDLHELGYFSLIELVDALPDVFMRKQAPGIKKDFRIYAAAHSSINDPKQLKGGQLLEHISSNIRQILQGCPEGVRIQDFFHLYSINCNEPLYLRDLGFDCLETFLLTISEMIPLRLVGINDKKTVHYVQHEVISLDHQDELQLSSNDDLPLDAAPSESKYEWQTIPDRWDLTKYVPIFTSSILNPSFLWIQLQETVTSLGSLMDDLEDFYTSHNSKHYKMKDSHVMVGAVCVAQWPGDQHWHRVQIVSIPSLEFVDVLYVDYGSRSKIPRSTLRYIKKVHLALPAQAIRGRLAHLKPPNGNNEWDSHVKHRLLELCRDVPLMGLISDVSNGYLSLVVCNTNEKEDVYINDLLVREGFADYCTMDDYDGNSSSSHSKPAYENMEQLQTLFQAAATVRQNEALLNTLLSALTLSQANKTPAVNHLTQQKLMARTPVFPNEPLELSSAVENNSFRNQQPLVNQTSVNAYHHTRHGVTDNPVSQFTPTPQQKYFNMTASTSESGAQASSVAQICDPESDLFVDDDEIFQTLCNEAGSISKRHIKRIRLREGYRIHVIAVKDKPYVSAGDLSALFWSDKDADHLARRLQFKEIAVPTIAISEKNNEDIFIQLDRYKVKGCQKFANSSTSITLYPLRNVVDILNIFGHPSATIRDEIESEIRNFNPSDPLWMDFPDADIGISEEEIVRETDNDKIKKLCLYDLKAMKEGLSYRRLKIFHDAENMMDVSHTVEEVTRIETLYPKIVQRIKEIEEICSLSARKHNRVVD